MIVALAGRRIDKEKTGEKRFPMSAIPFVKEKLYQFFIKNKVNHLVCSGADGSDLLAIDIAKELKIQISLVLPYSPDTFRSTSVVTLPDTWAKIFNWAIQFSLSNGQLHILYFDPGDPQVYFKTNIEIMNFGERLKKETQDALVALVIWEQRPKKSNDATYHFKLLATERNLELIEINTELP